MISIPPFIAFESAINTLIADLCEAHKVLVGLKQPLLRIQHMIKPSSWKKHRRHGQMRRR